LSSNKGIRFGGLIQAIYVIKYLDLAVDKTLHCESTHALLKHLVAVNRVMDLEQYGSSIGSLYTTMGVLLAT
jgi:hypothetical protein